MGGLSPNDRIKIKAQLLRAHAAFHRVSWRDTFRYVPVMQQAFGGIAGILFQSHLLTVELLENQLRLFMVDAAKVADWLPAPTVVNEDQWKMFKEERSKFVFTAEVAEWKSKILEAEANNGFPARPSEPVTESIGAQLNRLREECRLTVEELAEELEVEARSVYRHLSNTSVPYKRHVAAYERVFSQILKRKVVISKTSGRCQ